MKKVILIGAAILLTSAGNAMAQGKYCLIEGDTCSELYADKNKAMLRQLRKKDKNSVDLMTSAVIYSTFEKLQSDANKSCKKNDRVSVKNYKPLFILRNGREKRALMVKDRKLCTWVKVK